MSIRVNKDGSITRDGKTYKNKSEYAKAMKEKRDQKRKTSKDDKIKVQEGRQKGVKVYSKSSMFPKARDEQRTKTAKARPFSVAFRSAKDAGKKTFLWKGKSYHTKTKSEMEAGSREKEKFERMAKSKKVPNNQSTFNKFKDSKTLAEFFGKLKKK